MSKNSSKTTMRRSPELGKKNQRRIWVTDEITRALTVGFNTSNVTVLNALKFASYSKQALQIREEAMLLMDETVESNRKLMADWHD